MTQRRKDFLGDELLGETHSKKIGKSTETIGGEVSHGRPGEGERLWSPNRDWEKEKEKDISFFGWGWTFFLLWNVESLLSIDDEATVEAVLAFIFEDDSSKSNDSSVFDDFDLFPYEIQTIEFSSIMLAQPLAKVKLLPGKYENPSQLSLSLIPEPQLPSSTQRPSPDHTGNNVSDLSQQPMDKNKTKRKCGRKGIEIWREGGGVGGGGLYSNVSFKLFFSI